MRFVAFTLILLALAIPVRAQTEGADDNGFIIGLLEDNLSTETRKIRLSGVNGVLSSSATVERITISDPEGIWLQIEDARIVWNRSALLRGRVEVEELAARKISIPRGPIADPNALPEAEAQPLKLPELPVSVALGGLEIEELSFGESLFGLAAIVQVSGDLSIVEGQFETTLEMERLDGPGGALSLQASFDGATEELAVDLDFAEPPDGVVANALNLPGKPSVNLDIEGRGPLSDLSINLDLAVDGAQLVDGNLRLQDQEGLQGFDAELIGKLQDVVPDLYAPFFGGDATLRIAGSELADGGLRVSDFSVETAGLQLTGSGETLSGGFLKEARLTGQIGSADGAPLILPFGDGSTSLQDGTLDFNFGVSQAGDWGGELQIRTLRSGEIEVQSVSLDLGGESENISSATERALSGRFRAALEGIGSEKPEIEEALGDRIDATALFNWEAGAPLSVRNLVIAGAGISLEAEGDIADLALDGQIVARIGDLSPFADLAGRDLAGALTLATEGRVEPLSGAFDVDLRGSAESLVLGTPTLDALLEGSTRLSGGLARSTSGVVARAFRLQNDNLTLTAQGRYASSNTDFAVTAALSDIGLIHPESAGAASVVAQALGPADRITLKAEVSIPNGQLVERDVRNLKVAFEGEVNNGGSELDGALRGTGSIGEADLALSGALEVNQRFRALRSFELVLGETQLEGSVSQGGDGLIAGSIDVKSPDLSVPATLLLAEAEGVAELGVILSRSEGGQRLQLTGFARDIVVEQHSLEALDLDLDIRDLLGVPLAEGRIEADRAILSGVGITELEVQADRTGLEMDLRANALLDRGTEINLAGALTNLDPGFRLNLVDLVLRDGEQEAVLSRPATLEMRGALIGLSTFALKVGDGEIRAEGSVSDRWLMTFDLANVPLSVADLVVPDLALEGYISGAARLFGPREAPDVSFDIDARALSAAPVREIGFSPFNLTARGRTDSNRLDITAGLEAENTGRVTLSGALPLTSDAGRIDLAAEISNLNLSELNQMTGNQGLEGRIGATADISGTLARPSASFAGQGERISARALRSNGVQPIRVRANGDFARNVLTLESAEISDANGLQVSASGRVPVAQQRVNIDFQGTVPLALANVALAEQAIQIGGRLVTSGTVSGPWAGPQFSGTATIANATLVDPLRNVRVNNIDMNAGFSGRGIDIRSLSGELAQGGSISGQGRVGFTRGIPADLALRLNNARYSDGQLVDTTISANITVDGPLAGAGRISGRVDIGKTEITVPNSFGIREGVLLDIEHRNLPADAALTLDRAGLPEQERGSRSGSSDLRLDVEISAPNQIFVRGRGLDVEMGGVVRLRGRVSDVLPIGEFALIRGRINILGQRLEFDEGVIQLSGDFDPRIRLVATTNAQETTVNLVVEGRVSDPQVTLTSSPELPQDELLALLIFQRNLSELTPFQVAQLATAAATLAGGGSGGILEGLRSATGLSNLDVVTGDEGEIGVRAGAYLRDNIYLDVEAEDDGDARATINIDITDNLRGRATFGNDGEGSIGIFYEKDY